MSAILAPIALFVGVVFIAIGSWPKRGKRNHRIDDVLGAPSRDCKREYIP